MEASGGPTNGTRIIHHGTDELLVQQSTIPDGETASPVQERSQRSQSLCLFLSHLIDMFRSVEPFIKDHPKITGVVDPLNWLPEKRCLTSFVHHLYSLLPMSYGVQLNSVTNKETCIVPRVNEVHVS